MDFGRLVTAMVTPFSADGSIDWDTTGRLLNYLIEDQVSDGIVVCGTTGESPTLNDEEKRSLFSFAVKQAGGRCKIIAGTGSNDTAHSIHLTKIAEQCGVDAVLLVAPYYNKPTQEGLYQHFKAIAEATTLPVMLYNVPGRTIVSLSAATTLRLAQLPNVVATKECAGLDQVTEIVTGAPDGFLVYSGDDSSALPALAVGAHGIVSVASHVVGKPMKAMIQAYLEGNVAQAAKLHGDNLPIFKGLFDLPNPVLVKAALELRGLPVGGVRLPLVAANESEIATLRQILN
ncbi:4-hydroxy-tetrahydrodipicolinate synthase [Paenibacillus rhizovicinus]|uniref:4-hydroxy-tetrahydrodipicolinate synthase n=1 Tax=Paenibacillus rhizovicinus TaxID=2704463 RepID=A0A6C0NZV7_9BACL|nr:4-hydroxy-tetrahydrodipicolinate synthase [Paenibacillus rhizovicinus]QHW30012.1 4-hydroxy-tetrahydrodipicolinate synthase [Paenibacillus rhizovicinus]